MRSFAQSAVIAGTRCRSYSSAALASNWYCPASFMVGPVFHPLKKGYGLGDELSRTAHELKARSRTGR